MGFLVFYLIQKVPDRLDSFSRVFLGLLKMLQASRIARYGGRIQKRKRELDFSFKEIDQLTPRTGEKIIQLGERVGRVHAI